MSFVFNMLNTVKDVLASEAIYPGTSPRTVALDWNTSEELKYLLDNKVSRENDIEDSFEYVPNYNILF